MSELEDHNQVMFTLANLAAKFYDPIFIMVVYFASIVHFLYKMNTVYLI